MEKNKLIAFILIIVAMPFNIYTLSGTSEMSLDIAIQVIRHASQPSFYGSRIILTYEDTRPVRSVQAIFDHEGYRYFHLYERNKYNVFCLVYRVPRDLRVLKYRLVIDGLVTHDPNNPKVELNAIGIAFSLVEIPRSSITLRIRNPDIDENGGLVFRYKTLPGRIVSIAGDFNGWDPYTHLLAETSSGNYEVRIRVSAGEHYYAFFVNGEKRLDPYNPRLMTSSTGEEVNAFFVAP